MTADTHSVLSGLKPLSRLDHPREMIRQFTPNWFAATMGTGILALALPQVPGIGPSLKPVGEVLWFFNIALFALFAGLYGARWVMFGHEARRIFGHNTVSMFIGTIPMGLATIINGCLAFGIARFGNGIVPVAHVLWWIDAAMSLACGVLIPYMMFTRHEHSLDGMTAVWLLPVVAAEFRLRVDAGFELGVVGLEVDRPRKGRASGQGGLRAAVDLELLGIEGAARAAAGALGGLLHAVDVEGGERCTKAGGLALGVDAADHKAGEGRVARLHVGDTAEGVADRADRGVLERLFRHDCKRGVAFIRLLGGAVAVNDQLAKVERDVLRLRGADGNKGYGGGKRQPGGGSDHSGLSSQDAVARPVWLASLQIIGTSRFRAIRRDLA